MRLTSKVSARMIGLQIMRCIAVVDIKEDFSFIAIFTRGWKGAELAGSSLVRGGFTDSAWGTARKVKEEIDRISPEKPFTILLLPRRFVHVTTTEIPARNETFLKKMMEFEVTRHFPVSPERLVYDFMIAGRVKGGFAVNIAGLKRTDFNACFEAAQKAGIAPDEVSFSSSAWISPNVPDDDITKRFFIEVAPEGFEMSVVDGTRILYSRFNFFKPKLEEKNFHKRDVGSRSPARGIAEKILAELQNIRLVSGIEHLNEYLKKLFIAGGALQKDVGRQLAEMPEFADSQISCLPAGEGESGFGYVATVAGAQAMDKDGRRFNFIPADMASGSGQETAQRFKKFSIAIAVLAVLWIASTYLAQWKTTADLKRELARLKAEVGGVEEVHLRIEEYRSYFESFKKISATPSFDMELLQGITNALPKNSFLTDMEIHDGVIMISGLSKDASSLLKIMEADSHFKSVQMAGAVKTVGENEKFKIRMELE